MIVGFFCRTRGGDRAFGGLPPTRWRIRRGTSITRSRQGNDGNDEEAAGGERVSHLWRRVMKEVLIAREDENAGEGWNVAAR